MTAHVQRQKPDCILNLFIAYLLYYSVLDFFAFGGQANIEVRKMKYNSLDELLGKEKRAKEYFSNLPDYAREQIESRAQSVNSFESLKDYAQNILRGEG